MERTYSTYPAVTEQGVPESERQTQEQLLLIEQIQEDLWGAPINDGKILKPSNPNLMINWIAGGIFQYRKGEHTISSTYALSLPEENPFVDDDGVTWSGLGYEYFIETSENAQWAVKALVTIALNIYANPSSFPTPGTFIRGNSGFLIPDKGPASPHLLCLPQHQIETPDGRCQYLQFVPLNDQQLEAYIALGDKKSGIAKEWYASQGLDPCVRWSASPA